MPLIGISIADGSRGGDCILWPYGQLHLYYAIATMTSRQGIAQRGASKILYTIVIITFTDCIFH